MYSSSTVDIAESVSDGSPSLARCCGPHHNWSNGHWNPNKNVEKNRKKIEISEMNINVD